LIKSPGTDDFDTDKISFKDFDQFGNSLDLQKYNINNNGKDHFVTFSGELHSKSEININEEKSDNLPIKTQNNQTFKNNFMD